MTWVDGSRWDRVRGPELVDLLVGVYRTEHQMLHLLERVGIGPAVMPAPMELGLR